MSYDFLQKLFKPGYDIVRKSRELMESAGLLDPVDHFIYKNIEDPLFQLLFTQLYDLKVYDDDLIPTEEDGCCLFTSNHMSIIDPPVLSLAVFHNSKRMPFQLTKSELGEDTILGNFVSMNQVIYIKRGVNDTEALQKCVDVMVEDNRPVLVFPEGTYGPGDGEFLPFKTGATRIAFDAKVPIVPLAIYGTDKIMGAEASRKFKAPESKGKIRVKFGKPITIKDMFGNKTDPKPEDFKKATQMIKDVIQALYNSLANDEALF